jgi:hypothetical protein
MFIEGEITVGDRGLQRPNLDHQILTATTVVIELHDQTLMATPAVIQLCHHILMAHRHLSRMADGAGTGRLQFLFG